MLSTALLALCALALIVALFWFFADPVTRFIAAVAMLVLSVLPAAAGSLDAFISAATPGLVELLGVAVTLLLAWIGKTAKTRWGLDIEARHREALQSAILTGARLALAGKLDGAAAIQLILKHVSASVPDAMIALQPPTAVLENLARAKLQEAAQVVGSDKLTEAMRKALAG